MVKVGGVKVRSKIRLLMMCDELFFRLSLTGLEDQPRTSMFLTSKGLVINKREGRESSKMG